MRVETSDDSVDGVKICTWNEKGRNEVTMLGGTVVFSKSDKSLSLGS